MHRANGVLIASVHCVVVRQVGKRELLYLMQPAKGRRVYYFKLGL